MSLRVISAVIIVVLVLAFGSAMSAVLFCNYFVS